MSVAIGMPHPSASFAARVEGHENEGRYQHSAERSHRRECGGSRIAQLTDDDLTLDLHADDEEEQAHQQVVDEMAEGLLEHVGPDRDTRTSVCQNET